MSVIWFFLSGVCHQLPDHSLYYGGQPLPLCARCTGTFLGMALTPLILWLMGQGRRSLLPPKRVGLILGIFVALWGGDGLNSLIQVVTGTAPLYPPQNVLRLATGLGAGIALGVVFYPIYHYCMWREVDPRRVVERVRQLLGPLLAAAGILGLLLGWPSAPYLFWAVIVAITVLGVLGVVNAALVVMVRHKEGLAQRGIELLPYLAAGLLLALAETGAIAFLRFLLSGPSLARFGP